MASTAARCNSILAEIERERITGFDLHSFGQRDIGTAVDRLLGEHDRDRRLAGDRARDLARLLGGFLRRGDVVGDADFLGFLGLDETAGPDDFLGHVLADQWIS